MDQRASVPEDADAQMRKKMEARKSAMQAKNVTPPSGVAAIAVKAAAAAKAVQAAKAASTNGTKPEARGGAVCADAEKGVPTQVIRQSSPLRSTLNAGQAPHGSPQMFSMDADDDSAYDAGSPSHVVTLPLNSEANSPEKTAPGLSCEEEQEYAEIEARFERFRQHQSDVERNVTALLERLNTQIRVPSSAASSECGDLTSLASSEWDTESLGPTEDGLSSLSSPMASPREGLLQKAASSSSLPHGWEIDRPELFSAAEKLTPAAKAALGVPCMTGGKLSTTPRSASRTKRLSHGSAPGIGESGSLSDLRARSSQVGSADESTLSQEKSTEKSTEQPRLTSLLLEQSGLAGHHHEPARDVHEAWPEASVPTFGTRTGSAQKESSSPNDAMPSRPVFGGLADPAPSSTATAAVQPAKTADAPSHTASLPTTASIPAAPMASPPVSRSAQPGISRQVSADKSPLAVNLLPSFGGDGMSGMTAEEEELARWQGWTVVATPEGRLFFHSEQGQLSQWTQPTELVNVLGEWVEMTDDSQPDRPRFWRNDLLKISLWKDPRQTTNIFQAALDGNLFFLQLYAEVDGQLDVIDPKGRGALHYACAGGATQSALFLLQRSVQVDLPDETASTPLMFACRYGYASIVKLLLDAKAGLNMANISGNTALHEAASMGHLDCLHLLLLCGASPTARNAEGDSAADIATAKKHYSCLTLLRRHVNCAPRSGNQNARHPPASMGIAASPARLPENPLLHNTVLDVAGGGLSTTSESDPFYGTGTGSSSDPASFAPHVTATASSVGGYPSATHMNADATANSGRPHRHGRRAAGRPPQVEYVGHSTDSDLDEVAEVLQNDALVESESGGASSAESSDDQRARGPSSRSRHKRREKAPVALGLLNRMQVGRWFGAARRWVSGPVAADLGETNKFTYNQATGRWELPDDEDPGGDM